MNHLAGDRSKTELQHANKTFEFIVSEHAQKPSTSCSDLFVHFLKVCEIAKTPNRSIKCEKLSDCMSNDHERKTHTYLAPFAFAT